MMLKSKLTVLTICLSFLTFGQMTEKEKLMQLAQVYKNNMFIGKSDKADLKKINTDVPESLKTATDFITQTLTTKSKLMTSAYLSRPTDAVLKQVFVIRELQSNMRQETTVGNEKFLDSILNADIAMNELVDSYYDMLFIADGNKNKPFNLSKVNFQIEDYNFKNETEKGVFFLQAADYCGKMIWGFMNIPDPPNTKKALELMKLYPKVNGKPYYLFTDLYFPDFEMLIEEGKGPQSYKSFYLNKYYELLLSHLLCLIEEDGSKDQASDLMFNSILRAENLYKYTELKEVLEGIFQEQ